MVWLRQTITAQQVRHPSSWLFPATGDAYLPSAYRIFLKSYFNGIFSFVHLQPVKCFTAALLQFISPKTELWFLRAFIITRFPVLSAVDMASEQPRSDSKTFPRSFMPVGVHPAVNTVPPERIEQDRPSQITTRFPATVEPPIGPAPITAVSSSLPRRVRARPELKYTALESGCHCRGT